MISTVNCVLRVLKWHKNELPPSTSGGRFDFYQHNLFALEGNDPHPEDPIPPLNLVAAWNTDADHALDSFSIVCPLGEVDHHVEIKWWRTLPLPPLGSPPPALVRIPPEPTLDEITPKLSAVAQPTQRPNVRTGVHDVKNAD